MSYKAFPVIDAEATGENILRLRKQRGLSVRDMQAWFGFEEPQAIYKWQKGKSLPSVDNLYALGALLDVPMEAILIARSPQQNISVAGQQGVSCCPDPFYGAFFAWVFTLVRLLGLRRQRAAALPISAVCQSPAAP